MSTLINADPKELRPLLHEQIDRLTDAELEAVRRALLEVEARRLRESLGRAVDEAYAAGQLEQLEATIQESRARHPYR